MIHLSVEHKFEFKFFVDRQMPVSNHIAPAMLGILMIYQHIWNLLIWYEKNVPSKGFCPDHSIQNSLSLVATSLDMPVVL